jgi:hypothetical protein
VNIPQNIAPSENYMVLEIERHHFNGLHLLVVLPSKDNPHEGI